MLTPDEAAQVKRQLVASGYLAPPKIDFLTNGTCILRCEGCWGPDWKIKGSVGAAEWVQVADILSVIGLAEVVISGGEPLLRRDLEDILEGLKALRLRVTLSTINHRILERSRILPNVDDLGIPLDGHTAEIHALSRPPAGKVPPHRSFWDSMLALQKVPTRYPHLDLTLRTVVDGYNTVGEAPSVLEIPRVVVEHGVDISRFRWKLYQWNRWTGPRQDRSATPHPRDIALERFEEVTAQVEQVGSGFRSVTIQPVTKTAGRYFLIEPDGGGRLEIAGDDGFPQAVTVGHISDLYGMVRALNGDHDKVLLDIGRRRTS
jgi:hypothetical protein